MMADFPESFSPINTLRPELNVKLRLGFCREISASPPNFLKFHNLSVDRCTGVGPIRALLLS